MSNKHSIIPSNSLKESYQVKEHAVLLFNSKLDKDERYVFWDDKHNSFCTFFDLLEKNGKYPDKTIQKDFGMFTIHNVNTNNSVSFTLSSSIRDELGFDEEQTWESKVINGKKWKLVILSK